IPSQSCIFLKLLFLIWYIAYTLVNELVSSNTVIKKTNPKPNKSSDEGPPAVEFLSAKYTPNKLANKTVSPPRKNQNPINLFLPSSVALSGLFVMILGFKE